MRQQPLHSVSASCQGPGHDSSPPSAWQHVPAYTASPAAGQSLPLGSCSTRHTAVYAFGLCNTWLANHRVSHKPHPPGTASPSRPGTLQASAFPGPGRRALCAAGTPAHLGHLPLPRQAGTWAVLGFLMGAGRSSHTPGAWVIFTLTMTNTSHLPPATGASAFSK